MPHSRPTLLPSREPCCESCLRCFLSLGEQLLHSFDARRGSRLGVTVTCLSGFATFSLISLCVSSICCLASVGSVFRLPLISSLASADLLLGRSGGVVAESRASFRQPA